MLFHLLKTFGLFALWVVAGWFVSNLMDSSARLTDLTVVSCYGPPALYHGGAAAHGG